MFLTAGYIHFIAFRLLPLRTFPQPFSHSISAIQTFSSAVQPFDLISSKLFRSRSSVQPRPFKNFLQLFIHSSSSVQEFSAAVHPFKNFPQPFSRSTSSVHKLSSAVQPFSVTVLNGFWTRFLSVRLPCVQPFERIP